MGEHVPVPQTEDPARLTLRTREDLVAWLRELLPDPYADVSSAPASYDADVRTLEYVSRPLWAVFSLVASGEYDVSLVEPYLDRIARGLTPGDELQFPHPSAKARQVVVEQAVYGYGLLACGDVLLPRLTPEQRDFLASWLSEAGSIELPWGNWYLFRILVNEGLAAAGLPYDPERLAADYRAVSSMYVGDGWYEDGMPFQRDYYIALTFHLCTLVLARHRPESPLAAVARERACAFEEDFLYWFDGRGRSLPFGRSISYRFAHSSFWAAEALSGIHGHSLGEVKHLLLANLSWWHGRPVMSDGRISVGYGYPNQSVGEDYTGPGAPGWAFKSLIVLALPSSDEFWRVEPVAPERLARRCERRPGMLLQAGESHTYALSGMQYSAGKVLQRMSKYGKLCYSTAFGWNVSRDVSGIGNFAVDSALALSIAGTDQFVTRASVQTCEVAEGYVHTLWTFGKIAQVETWLVPVDERWHLRVHRVDAAFPLETHEGAFPVFGWSRKYDAPVESERAVMLERVSEDGRVRRSAILDASGYAGRIAEALGSAGLSQLAGGIGWTPRDPEVIPQNPATNIYDPERNAVPALRADLPAGSAWLGCLVLGDPDARAPYDPEG